MVSVWAALDLAPSMQSQRLENVRRYECENSSTFCAHRRRHWRVLRYHMTGNFRPRATDPLRWTEGQIERFVSSPVDIVRDHESHDALNVTVRYATRKLRRDLEAATDSNTTGDRSQTAGIPEGMRSDIVLGSGSTFVEQECFGWWIGQ